MKKKLRSLAVLFLFAAVAVPYLFFSESAHAANAGIDKITMDVFIDSEGNANIEEVWQASVHEGTEGYRPYGNLMNCEIKDFYVTDEKGMVYSYEPYWDVDGGFYDKAYKCGINDTGSQKELCWGISEYGSRTYTLHYTITNIINQYQDCQGLYFSFMPREMEQEPRSAVITIRSDMPFDESNSKIWAFGYPNGTIRFENGAIIMDSDGKLSSRHYMTTLVQINQDYFKDANPVNKSFQEVYDEAMEGAKSPTDTKPVDYLITIGIAICLFTSIALWYVYGRDETPTEILEFYPPEGLNSTEMAFMYQGEVEDKDIVSLIVYLANKGYLKIEEYESKSMFTSSTDFRLVKLKEYDGFDDIERRFFNGLFGARISVTKSGLENSFYRTLNSLKSDINTKQNKKKIFEESSLNKSLPIMAMIILTLAMITIRPVLSAFDSSAAAVVLIFPVIALLVWMSVFIRGRGNIFVKIFISLWALGFGGGPMVSTVLPTLELNRMFLINFVFGIISIIVMIVVRKYISKRNRYGVQMLGRIQGFKRFLEIANKEKLEALVMETPTYFYDILPYTYVLGISEKWIEKFETIACEPPSWYGGYHTFSMMHFGSFMNSTMKSANSAMSSSPSSGGGGGSFSGGGGGAGGSSSGGGFR